VCFGVLHSIYISGDVRPPPVAQEPTSTRLLRVTMQNSTTWEVRSIGEHSAQPRAIRGLTKAMKSNVDDKLLDLKPAKVMAQLVLKRREENANPTEGVGLPPLPDRKKLSNRKKGLNKRRRGPDKLETRADLAELTNGMLMPKTASERAKLDDKKMFVLPGGAFGDDSINNSDGVVVSTLALLGNYERATAAWGRSIPACNDATFKLCVGGWPLMVFCALAVYYNTETRKIHAQVRPMAFMLCKSESEASCSKLFSATKQAVYTLTGKRMEVCPAISDRSLEEKNAFDAEFPGNSWVHCWPHLARKPKEKWSGLLNDKLYRTTVSAHMTQLHLSRSTSQFNQLAKVVVRAWVDAGEKQLAELVKKEYLTPPYNR